MLAQSAKASIRLECARVYVRCGPESSQERRACTHRTEVASRPYCRAATSCRPLLAVTKFLTSSTRTSFSIDIQVFHVTAAQSREATRIPDQNSNSGRGEVVTADVLGQDCQLDPLVCIQSLSILIESRQISLQLRRSVLVQVFGGRPPPHSGV